MCLVLVLAAAFAVTVTMTLAMTTAAATFAVTMTMTLAMTTAAATFAVTVTMTLAMTAAAATFAVAVTVTLAMTTAATAFAFAAAVLAATAAALAAHHVNQSLDFIVSSVAHHHHFALEVQILASQRMVQVYDHRVVLHLKHQALKAVAIAVNERKHGTGVNHFLVEVTVDAENLFVEFKHMFLLVRAVSIVNLQHEVESLASLQFVYFCFKSIKRHTHTGDKLERVFSRSFFYEFVNTFFVIGVQFVSHRNILVWSLFHFM